jgi:hypothetical protein
MSRSESDQIDNLEKYRSDAGVESKTADISSDDHALKKAFGSGDDQKSFKFDAEIIAERISNWYDSDGATIREFLSNAETACIRRAKMELENAGKDVPTEITEVLEKAKAECNYDPVIEVTYNRKSDDTRLIVEDNGCGIDVEEYQVLRNIGYSATHDQSGVGDGFGMGIMSFAQLTGTHGMMKFSTHSFPSEDREETAYSVAMYVTNLEFLDGEPSDYGTRFEFPAFSSDAQNINIPEKVEEFSEGMVVPVIYRDFDSSGKETSRSDDYLPTRMEDAYSDDSMVIIYEDEFFKAVMSPDSKEIGRGRTTYNISMPIRRNCDEFGSEPRFEAPWKWDYRGKKENGPIVNCPSDPSLEGLVPKEDTKYDKLLPDLQEKCVPMSEVPDDAVSMPEPASSRDSFKSGHDDFWQYVSEKLNEAWSDIAKERFEELDSWDDFLDMDREQKNALFRAYDHFGPKYDDATRDTIHDTLKDSLGVSLDKDLGERLHESKSFVRVVSRGSGRAHTKGATSSKHIWKVIDEAPDGIYMGKSISQKKAEIVWGLGETHIVRLDSDETYSEYEQDWGWEKAKDLPNRNLKEKLPELDDDVAEKFENVSDSQSNNTKSTGGNGKNPKTFRGRVRVGSNSRKYFSNHKLDKLAEKLQDDEHIRAGHYECRYLIVCKNDVSARGVASRAEKRNDIGAIRVPEYAYDYLVSQPNAYESKDALRDDVAGTEITLSDGTTKDLQDLSSDQCLLVGSSHIEDDYEGREDRLVELLDYDSDEFEQYTWLNASEFNGSWGAETDATVISMKGSGNFKDFNDYNYHGMTANDLYMRDKLGEKDDMDSEKYNALFGYRYGNPDGDELRTLVDIAADAGLGK